MPASRTSPSPLPASRTRSRRSPGAIGPLDCRKKRTAGARRSRVQGGLVHSPGGYEMCSPSRPAPTRTTVSRRASKPKGERSTALPRLQTLDDCRNEGAWSWRLAPEGDLSLELSYEAKERNPQGDRDRISLESSRKHSLAGAKKGIKFHPLRH